MAMGPAIRPYRSADAEAVSDVIRTTMRISNAPDYAMERLQPLVDCFSPQKVEQLSRERTTLVAEIEGRVVGTAGLEANELVTFFVLPQHQGYGIGSALLREIEAIAADQGRTRLGVDSSIAGAAFYERHGYRRTGLVIDGTAGPQIAMGKQLG